MPRRRLEETIHEAIGKGLFQQVRLLVLLGRSVNTKNARCQTPLMLCSLVEDEQWGVRLARLLLETHGAVLDQTDARGLTALHYACLYRRRRLIETFLGYSGFDVQRLDLLFNRPVHYAAAGTGGDPLAVELLLTHDRSLGVSPSAWMTENAAGNGPLALAKMYRNDACYVALRDLAGEVKYPSERDLHLTRLITDPNYAEEKRLEEIARAGCTAVATGGGSGRSSKGDVDVSFMDRYHPSPGQRQRLVRASRAVGYSSVASDVSHLENETDRRKMTKYAVHFSLDLGHWTYLDAPRHKEIYFKARPAPEDKVDQQQPQQQQQRKQDTIKADSKNKEKKAKAEEIKKKEEPRKSKNVDGKPESELEDNEEAEEEEEEEAKDPRSACREYVLEEYIPECKEKEDGDDDPGRLEDADEEGGAEDPGNEKDKKKQKQLEKGEKQTQKEKDDRKKKKPEGEAAEKKEEEGEEEPDEGSFVVTKTTRIQPPTVRPTLRPLATRCRDADATANFRRPGRTVTNVGKRPSTAEERARKSHLVCAILELVLPRVGGSGPPYPARCRRTIREVFESGLFVVESLAEQPIRWDCRRECDMFGVYCREYAKMDVVKVECLPRGSRCPLSVFEKITYVPKAPRLRPCPAPFPYFRVDYFETCERPPPTKGHDGHDGARAHLHSERVQASEGRQGERDQAQDIAEFEGQRAAGEEGGGTEGRVGRTQMSRRRNF